MTVIMAKTVCMNCNHHNKATPEQSWMNHKCLHPELQKQPEQDPVTGVIGFAAKNSLGLGYTDDERHPFCRDHNRGNCQHYEEKKQPIPFFGQLFSRTGKSLE